MKNKIQYIVFSLNNPQGLSLTLQSLKHIEDKENVIVLYSSNAECEEGYELVKEIAVPVGTLEDLSGNGNDAKQEKNTLQPSIAFPLINVGQNLKENLLKYINKDDIPVCFMTDEDVLFNSFNTSIIYDCLAQDDVFCFSLRLGNNVKDCPQMNCENVIIAKQNNGYIKWDWTLHYLDFGYPLALSGHVFNSKEVTKLIKNISFRNHLELEEELQIFQNYPKTQMCAFDHSVSVGLTNVEEYIKLEDFLDGYIPDYDSMDFKDISSVCKEIHFENRKRA